MILLMTQAVGLVTGLVLLQWREWKESNRVTRVIYSVCLLSAAGMWVLSNTLMFTHTTFAWLPKFSFAG
ncbi:hypothetical protein C7445_101373 [Alicyclobacillus sacchari]|uniref:Uncharacterized protein n=1 Tax=Alicyclobacillus sacchari TaxID=392010 RepID=A0A4V6QD47_9BACL|nr:hypothetical protein [Alicyclobacillus sacchari]TDY51371.1 hypothetical protein C7445_101373 [Alicyclobacillus sacchari]GMA56693.1 hypothetical protein GCM10025858_11960 [Alicyclobacillus sacchari]